MSTPFHFSPRVPAPPHSTPVSASAYILPTPKSLKPPINNPYDKFTQPEFDAWIGGITGALRQALGQAEEEQPNTHKGTSNAYKSDQYPRYDSIGADESVDEAVNDSFAEIRARRATGKGKARDPREGPGLGQGDTSRPIEIVSSDEEEEEEVELSILQLDGEESEEEVDEEEGGEEILEGEQGEQEEDGEEQEYSETEEPAWQGGPNSSSQPPELKKHDTLAQQEEEYVDEAGEEEDCEDEEEYDEEYDEEYGEVEDGPGRSSPEVIELISDDEEDVQNTQNKKVRQANEVEAEEEEEKEENEGSDEYSDEESELVYPQAVRSTPYVYGPKSARARRQPEYEVVDDQDHDELLDDEDDELQMVPPTENGSLSHQQSRGFSPDGDTRIEIRCPWQGPRMYAEDFYAGGDARASVNNDTGANRLEIKSSFEAVDFDEQDDVDDEIQPLSQDTSFPPETISPRRSKAEIPDHWLGPRLYAQDYYAGGPVPLPVDENVDIDHLGPEDDEHVILDAEEEDLKEAIEDEIQPLDADTAFPPQEEIDESLTDIPDPWAGAPMNTGDFYTSGDICTFPGERVDPSMLSGIGDIDDSIDAFLTPGALTPNQSDERTSMYEDDDNASIQVPTGHCVSTPSRRDEPIPADAEFISIDDSDEEPVQEAKLSPLPPRFEDTIYGSIYDFEEFHDSSGVEQPAVQVDEASDQQAILLTFEGNIEHPDTGPYMHADQDISKELDMDHIGKQGQDEAMPENRLADTPVPSTEIPAPSNSRPAGTVEADDTPSIVVIDDAVGVVTENARSASVPLESHHEPETVAPDVTPPVEVVEPEDSSSPSATIQPGNDISDISISGDKPALTVSSNPDDSLAHSNDISASESVVEENDETMEITPAGRPTEDVVIDDVEFGTTELETVDVSVIGAEHEIEAVQETSITAERQANSAEHDTIFTSSVEQKAESHAARTQLNDTFPVDESEADYTGVTTLHELLIPPSGRTRFPPISSVLYSTDILDASPPSPSAEESFSVEVEESYEAQKESATFDDPTYIQEDEDMLSEEDAVGEVDPDIEIVSVVTAADVEEREKHADQDEYTVEEPITEGRLTEEPPDHSPGLKAVSVEPSEIEDTVAPTEDGAVITEDIPSSEITPQPTHEVHEDTILHDVQSEAPVIMAEDTHVDVDAEKDTTSAPMEMGSEHMSPKVEDKTLDSRDNATNPTDFPLSQISSASHGDELLSSQETNTPHTTPLPTETSLPVTMTPSLLRSIKQSIAADVVEDQHQVPKTIDLQASKMHHHVLSSIEDAFFGPNLPNYFGDLNADFPSDQLHTSIFESVTSSPNPSRANAYEVEEADQKSLTVSTDITDTVVDHSIPAVSSAEAEDDSSNHTATVPESTDADLHNASAPVPSIPDDENMVSSQNTSSEQVAQTDISTIPTSVPDVSPHTLPASPPAPPPEVNSDKVTPAHNALPASTGEVVPIETFPVPVSVPDAYSYNFSTPGPSIFNSEKPTPKAPMLMPDAYPYNMSKPEGSTLPEVPTPSFFMPLTDKNLEETKDIVETGSIFGDWEDLEFQYPPEEDAATESKDSTISQSPVTEIPVIKVTSVTPSEPTVNTTNKVKQIDGTIQKSNLPFDDADKTSPKEGSLLNEVNTVALAESTSETSSIKTGTASTKLTAKRKRASSPPPTVAPKQVGQKGKGGKRSSKPDRKGKLQNLKVQTPEPASEETIHVRPRPKGIEAQPSQTEIPEKSVETSEAPAYRMLQHASRASSISSTSSDKFSGIQPSPTTNKPSRPPIQPLPLPQTSLFHAHGKNKKLQPLSNFPPKLAKQMQTQQFSLNRVPLIPRPSEPSTVSVQASPTPVPLPSSQKYEEAPPLVIPTSNIVPATNVAPESSPAPITPLDISPSPQTPAPRLPLPSTQLQSDAGTPTPTSTPVPAPAVHTPSHQTKPARTPSFTSSPVTRSHCRYHRISLPKEEGGPRVCFLVPGCSLNDKELMEEEEIEDHGDATVEDSYRMIKDLDSLNFSSDLIGVLRQLVGLDILREQEVFYLPQPGEEIAHRKNSLKKSTSEKSAMVRVPADSSSYAGSPGYSGSYAYSPSSFRGPTSTAGGSSPSVSGLRSFLDSEKGSSFAPTDTEEDNSDAEKPQNKRSRPSPSEERKAMGPPNAVSSGKGKEKVKGSRKSKATAKPEGEGATAAEKSEKAPRKPRKSTAKRGVKRSRTTEAVTAQEDEPLPKKLKAHLTAPSPLSPEKPPPS